MWEIITHPLQRAAHVGSQTESETDAGLVETFIQVFGSDQVTNEGHIPCFIHVTGQNSIFSLNILAYMINNSFYILYTYIHMHTHSSIVGVEMSGALRANVSGNFHLKMAVHSLLDLAIPGLVSCLFSMITNISCVCAL